MDSTRRTARAIQWWLTSARNLKAHYPAEFMAANLNSEIGDIERLVVLIEECRRMGLDVLPPDVNEGQVDFVAVKNEIRMGMAAIRNVGRSAVQAIVAAREADGPFLSRSLIFATAWILKL